jgi:tRNA dimethylallyltransferase
LWRNSHRSTTFVIIEPDKMHKQAKSKAIYAVAGPTASGKTALAVELALRLGGEVVNFDSVQIYRGIEIATAKPTAEEMRGVSHHLIDYVDPNVNYTSADWARDATEKIEEIEARGRTPILVGGTGFYLRTLMHPLFEGPATNASIRERLRAIHEKRGAEFLHRLLTKVDATSADKLFPRDYVRVMRALEVYFQTGERLSQQQPNRMPPPEFASRICLVVLEPPRAALYEKINVRTESHFDAGLVQEVKRLRAAGVRDDTNALGAHGYRRVCEYLRGERTFESAIEQSKQDVRNYAKRQLTWFRRENAWLWINRFGTDVEAIARIKEELA